MSTHAVTHPRALAAALLTALAVPAASAGAQRFQGIITATMHGENATVAYSIKGDKLRMDMSAGAGMKAATIVDRGAKKLYMLLPPHTYMERDLDTAAAGAVADKAKTTADFSWTGTHQTIAGIPCDDATVKDRDGTRLDMCIARGINFTGPGTAMGGRGRGPDWQSRVQGGFPMRVQRAGDPQPIMEVTKVEAKPLPDDLFAPPAGWQKMTIPMGRP